jgi:hypothetical protein
MTPYLFATAIFVASNLGINVSLPDPGFGIQQTDCRVNVQSEPEIEAFLSNGLYSSDVDATIRYKTISAWNTIGLEVTGGRRWSAINVRIYPGAYRARITMDIPEYSTSATFYLSADGVLKSEDGSMVFTCP